MKDKRIWIVIGCILVIGSSVTYYTNSYVRSQVNAAKTDTLAGAALGTAASMPTAGTDSLERGRNTEPAESARRMGSGPGAGSQAEVSPGVLGTEGAAALGAAADSPEAAAGAPASEEAVLSENWAEESSAAVPIGTASEAGLHVKSAGVDAAAPISPLTGVKSRDERGGLIIDYIQRLTDLDTQIQKIREEETDSNVYSIKTSAATELKLWEGELNTIYNALLDMLSQEEAKGLALEQQEWLKNRNVKAVENSPKNNSSVESIGYTSTLVSLTRDRAYELAGRYEAANGVPVIEPEAP